MPPFPSTPSAVRQGLLRWFSRHARELPWRARDRDPWAVWVSEVMLQQTRVEAVVEPFSRFVAAFPTLEALADAPESDVLARWSGLGYYRRARLLHAGARFVVREHGGLLPRDRDALRKVPGIGAYTAGALLSIAFGQREAAIDANVTRVTARLLGVRNPGEPASRRRVEEFAAALVDCRTPGDVNEALMDLGSAVCTAKAARCGDCPLARHCAAHASGEPEAFAGPRERKAPRKVDLACAVVRDGERVLFLRHADDSALLAGMWDLPWIETTGPGAEALRTLVRERAGLDVELDGPLVTVRHDIVGRRITAAVYEGTVGRRARAGPQGARQQAMGARQPAMGARQPATDARLLAMEELAAVGLPALPKKILRALRER